MPKAVDASEEKRYLVRKETVFLEVEGRRYRGDASQRTQAFVIVGRRFDVSAPPLACSELFPGSCFPFTIPSGPLAGAISLKVMH